MCFCQSFGSPLGFILLSPWQPDSAKHQRRAPKQTGEGERRFCADLITSEPSWLWLLSPTGAFGTQLTGFSAFPSNNKVQVLNVFIIFFFFIIFIVLQPNRSAVSYLKSAPSQDVRLVHPPKWTKPDSLRSRCFTPWCVHSATQSLSSTTAWTQSSPLLLYTTISIPSHPSSSFCRRSSSSSSSLLFTGASCTNPPPGRRPRPSEPTWSAHPGAGTEVGGVAWSSAAAGLVLSPE